MANRYETRDPKKLRPPRGDHRGGVRDEDLIERMAAHAKVNGILHPIRIRKLEDGAEEIVSGMTRLLAAIRAELEEVPVIVGAARMTDDEASMETFFENELRANYSIIQRGRFYREQMAKHGLNAKQLAAKLGDKKYESDISRALKALRLPESVQADIEAGAIAQSTAVYLADVDDAEKLQLNVEAAKAGRLKRDAAMRRFGSGRRGKAGRPADRKAVVKGKYRGLTYRFDAAEPAEMKSLALALLKAIDRAIELKLNVRNLPDLFAGEDSPA